MKEVKKAVEFLRAKPGYLKTSTVKLSNIIGVSEKSAEIAKKAVKKDIIYRASAKPVKKTKNPLVFTSSHKNYDINNVLVIPDTHFPFEKEGILEHCKKIQEKYNCGRVVHVGDEVDLCGISQWEKDPDGFSAGTEASLAQERMKVWYEAFPEVSVCIGNHTARPFRMARSNGIPVKFLKSYEEAWEAPKTWKWSEHWEFNSVLYTHGTGYSGPNAAIRIATRHRQNTVIGHIHSEAGIQYSASKIDLIWGMQVGGALDDKSYAAFYAKDQLKKSIVGCGVVLNGKLPIFEPMNL
jgi:hypothetical protein